VGIDTLLLFPSVAFLFNWIGFFLSFCLTTSAAGRYGAISGFGLSLIKWVLIVRVGHTSLVHFNLPSSSPAYCIKVELPSFLGITMRPKSARGIVALPVLSYYTENSAWLVITSCFFEIVMWLKLSMTKRHHKWECPPRCLLTRSVYQLVQSTGQAGSRAIFYVYFDSGQSSYLKPF